MAFQPPPGVDVPFGSAAATPLEPLLTQRPANRREAENNPTTLDYLRTREPANLRTRATLILDRRSPGVSLRSTPGYEAERACGVSRTSYFGLIVGTVRAGNVWPGKSSRW